TYDSAGTTTARRKRGNPTRTNHRGKTRGKRAVCHPRHPQSKALPCEPLPPSAAKEPPRQPQSSSEPATPRSRTATTGPGGVLPSACLRLMRERALLPQRQIVPAPPVGAARILATRSRRPSVGPYTRHHDAFGVDGLGRLLTGISRPEG